MLIQNQVGPIATNQSISPGILAPMRAGNMGDAIVSELHGRYYETTYRRNTFSGATQTGQTTSAGLTTAFVGLCLSNPIGSPVNLVVMKHGYTFLVAFAAASAIGLAYGYNAATAPTQGAVITPKNNFLNGPNGYGLLTTTSTLPTAATIQHLLGAGLTGAITTAPGGLDNIVDLEGSVIVPPGGYVVTYTSTASGATGAFYSFTWEEVPV
jgi:hypothetical protein